MNFEGIIRHLDDQGRLLIPKEVRHICNFNEGDAVQIIPRGSDTVLIKKYRELELMTLFVSAYSFEFYSIYHTPIAISNDAIILTSRGFRLSNTPHISDEVKQRIEEGQEYTQAKPFPVARNEDVQANIFIPITHRGLVIGSIILFTKERRDIPKMADAARFLSRIISSQMKY